MSIAQGWKTKISVAQSPADICFEAMAKKHLLRVVKDAGLDSLVFGGLAHSELSQIVGYPNASRTFITTSARR